MIFSPHNFLSTSARDRENIERKLIVSVPLMQQGEEVSLNGRKFAVAWSQWNQNGLTRIGISDTGARQILGFDLLSTQQPQNQPIHWFSQNPNQPIILSTQFNNPYRYLDITDLFKQAGIQSQIVNKTLNITFIPAQIKTIRQGNQPWGKRIVIEVDRPTFWQISQAKNEQIITLEALANPELISQFKPSQPANNSSRNNDEDDLGNNSAANNTSILSLENTEKNTKIKINLSASQGIRVSTLSNPNRIIIDLRPDTFVEREIVWTPGVIWRQQLVKLNNNDIFPVNLLEIDLKSPNISLKPITSNSNTLNGIAPLVNTARRSQVIAAINGGFFNRNNKLPLGAIRQNNQWLSSPILNRGAIAWNSQKQLQVGHLAFQETVTTSKGNRLPIITLNSGYVQGGIARYTKEWGANYTTLSDNEIVVLVRNNTIIQQLNAGQNGQDSFPIPPDGYLLILRSNNSASTALNIGTQINLETNTTPAYFSNYPNIIGAGPLLLQNRQIVLNAEAEKFSKAFQEQYASRSAIALNSQGKLIIVAVHNRIGGRGSRLQEFAQIMQKLDAVDALNLDGGSSTSLYLGGNLIDRLPSTAARVHNGIGVFFTP